MYNASTSEVSPLVSLPEDRIVTSVSWAKKVSYYYFILLFFLFCFVLFIVYFLKILFEPLAILLIVIVGRLPRYWHRYW